MLVGAEQGAGRGGMICEVTVDRRVGLVRQRQDALVAAFAGDAHDLAVEVSDVETPQLYAAESFVEDEGDERGGSSVGAGGEDAGDLFGVELAGEGSGLSWAADGRGRVGFGVAVGVAPGEEGSGDAEVVAGGGWCPGVGGEPVLDVVGSDGFEGGVGADVFGEGFEAVAVGAEGEAGEVGASGVEVEGGRPLYPHDVRPFVVGVDASVPFSRLGIKGDVSDRGFGEGAVTLPVS